MARGLKQIKHKFDGNYSEPFGRANFARVQEAVNDRGQLVISLVFQEVSQRAVEGKTTTSMHCLPQVLQPNFEPDAEPTSKSSSSDVSCSGRRGGVSRQTTPKRRGSSHLQSVGKPRRVP